MYSGKQCNGHAGGGFRCQEAGVNKGWLGDPHLYCDKHKRPPEPTLPNIYRLLVKICKKLDIE